MTKDRLILWSNLLLVFFVLITAAALYFFLLKEKTESAPNRSGALEILDPASGKVYGSRPIDDGAEFAIEFIHSVNQSPVLETFKVESGQIRPVSVRFYSFGAGMQSDLEEGQTMTQDGDAMVITGFSRTFSELNYTVGTVSDHLLIINGETVSLRYLCGRNAHIRIRLK
jgi:hypothetical protein